MFSYQIRFELQKSNTLFGSLENFTEFKRINSHKFNVEVLVRKTCGSQCNMSKDDKINFSTLIKYRIGIVFYFKSIS